MIQNNFILIDYQIKTMKDISLMYVVQFYPRVKHKKYILNPEKINLDLHLNKIKMPLPKPEKNEDKIKYVDRSMISIYLSIDMSSCQ